MCKRTAMYKTHVYRQVLSMFVHLITYVLNNIIQKFREFRKISENFGKFWNFRKIREFPENPGISENPGENFRDFVENFFRKFSKLQKVWITFRKNSLFS